MLLVFFDIKRMQPKPTIKMLREKCGHILRHIQELHQFYGEQKGYRIARKHVAWYLQGIQPDSVFRQTFNAINEPKEQLIVLEDFLNSILDKEKC